MLSAAAIVGDAVRRCIVDQSSGFCCSMYGFSTGACAGATGKPTTAIERQQQ